MIVSTTPWFRREWVALALLWGNRYGRSLWRRRGDLALFHHRPLPNQVVYLKQNIFECLLDVSAILGRRFDKRQVVLLREEPRNVCEDNPFIREVAFITNQHYHDRWVRVIAQLLHKEAHRNEGARRVSGTGNYSNDTILPRLARAAHLEPPLGVVVRGLLGYIIDEQSPNSATVVPASS
eukprot:COSAG05_NODE_769_length_7449_cov_7.225034_3_plen_180_part_00